MRMDDPTSITLDWACLRRARRILGGLLDGGELSVDDGIRLTEAQGRDLARPSPWSPTRCAARQAGDVVTYVVNRNINFTNVCIKHCTFCAFSRDHREEARARRAPPARAMNTLVCSKGGGTKWNEPSACTDAVATSPKPAPVRGRWR